jgi:hypothetical protein
VENGYTVTARTGDWQISRSSPAGGNPQPSIFSRSTNAQVSLEGPLFHLISFQTNDGSINSGISTATYSIEGFLNNTLVLSGSGTVSPDWEANSNPNPLQPLDRILISFNIGQTTSYGIDNIQLQAVPEPSFYFLLATFVGVFLIRSFCGHCYGFIRFGRGL